jgi:hypothetical protein
MIAAAPGSPLPLTSEVVDGALRVLENEPEVARALSECELYGKRGVASEHANSLFLPLEISILAPATLLEKLRQPEFSGRIRQAIDSALMPPAVVSELSVRSYETVGESAA